MSADSKTSKRTCSPCPSGQYQEKVSHRNLQCTLEGTCNVGQYFPPGVPTTASKSCVDCPPDTYQDQVGFEGNSCTPQTVCGPGARISPDSKTKARTCTACVSGTYIDENAHRIQECSLLVQCDSPLRDDSTNAFTDEATCNGRGAADASGKCTCKRGVTGCQCQCTVGANKDGTCFNCAPGYVGDKCQFSDAHTCYNHGVAQNDGTCQNCEDGFAGKNCQYSDDVYCCGAADVDDAGQCSTCGPGYSGEHCEYLNTIQCFGNGFAQNDGVCICRNGYTQESNCKECAPAVASSGQGQGCDVCIMEKLQSSFPDCDIPACTSNGDVISTPVLGEQWQPPQCECAETWSGARCECFEGLVTNGECEACADDTDGIRYTLSMDKQCIATASRTRRDLPRNETNGSPKTKHTSHPLSGTGKGGIDRARRGVSSDVTPSYDDVSWDCQVATTTTSTSGTTIITTSTTTTTLDPEYVRLLENEQNTVNVLAEREAEFQMQTDAHAVLQAEFDKRCGVADPGRRFRRQDNATVDCDNFNLGSCVKGECKPCFSKGASVSKSGADCQSACPTCMAYLDNCNGDDDDDDDDDVVAVALTTAAAATTTKSACDLRQEELAEAAASLALATTLRDEAKEALTRASASRAAFVEAAAALVEECETLSATGMDAQTTVLIVAIIILAIAQSGARYARSSTLHNHKVPYAVELIVFFSVLDQITDATYVINETFRTDRLNSLGVLFCVLPIAVMMAYFYFKCYRVATKENLMWRFNLATTPLTGVPFYLHYTLVYPVIATFISAVFLFACLVTVPIEALLLPLSMGIQIGWSRITDYAEWAKDKAMWWAEQGILGNVPAILIYLCLLVYGLLTMIYWIVLSTMLPLLYAMMMVLRTFTILPGVWVWIEEQCEFMTQFMKEPAATGFFKYADRSCARGCGQDIGVFRMFHPGLDVNEKQVPAIDYRAQYAMLSGTLVFEFVFESLPQIIIQIVNNFENGKWAAVNCAEVIDETSISRVGWRAFTVVSVALSAFVAVDSLYRQAFQTLIKGRKFGDPEVFGVDEEFALVHRNPIGTLAKLREGNQRRFDLEAERKVQEANAIKGRTARTRSRSSGNPSASAFANPAFTFPAFGFHNAPVVAMESTRSGKGKGNRQGPVQARGGKKTNRKVSIEERGGKKKKGKSKSVAIPKFAADRFGFNNHEYLDVDGAGC